VKGVAKCDVCGDRVGEGTVEQFDDHNQRNYVRHVFLSHPRNEDRIRIIQDYIDVYPRPTKHLWDRMYGMRGKNYRCMRCEQRWLAGYTEPKDPCEGRPL
jgi:hypothetical protein